MVKLISENFTIRAILVLGIIGLLASGIQPAYGQQSSSQLISIALEGGHANDWSFSPDISSEGRYVVFASQASNLIEQDTNPSSDIFLRDQITGETTLISINSHGTQSNGWSIQPRISANARYVTYTSLANNLPSKYALPDTNGLADIYLHDRNQRTTERISLSTEGKEIHGWSDEPAISGDGRYIVYASTASDILRNDSNQSKDIFLHDRKDGSTRLVSISSAGNQANGDSYRPIISASGRYVTFFSDASNLTPEGIPGIFIHDQVTSHTSRIPVPSTSAWGNQKSISREVGKPSISADGNLVLVSTLNNQTSNLYIYDRSQDNIIFSHQIEASKSINNPFSLASMSAGGRYIAFPSITPDHTLAIQIYDRKLDQFTAIPLNQVGILQDSFPSEIKLSPDGSWVAFTILDGWSNPQPTANMSIYLHEHGTFDDQIAQLYGWTTTGKVQSLSGVTFATYTGQRIRTDLDGNFYISGLPSGNHKIQPAKTGYEFSPNEFNLQIPVQPIPESGNVPIGVAFTAEATGIIEAARDDIGMPYSLTRGCESPFKPCGGPYNGFYSGDCTDLVIDAYREGANFAIDQALARDAAQNPRHYYRWHDARNSQDMWRFFKYTGQMLTHDQPYLIGDIVYFDWEHDGTIDHVAIVSEVNKRGRPVKMIDATGIIEENPSGLALEMNWEFYHDGSTQGHSRWNGSYTFHDDGSNVNFPLLLVAVDSPVIQISLRDEKDLLIDARTQQIPGGFYQVFDASTIISLEQPQTNSTWYFVELRSPLDASYELGIQTVDQDGVIFASSFTGRISAGEIEIVALQLFQENSKLLFNIPSRE